MDRIFWDIGECVKSTSDGKFRASPINVNGVSSSWGRYLLLVLLGLEGWQSTDRKAVLFRIDGLGLGSSHNYC